MRRTAIAFRCVLLLFALLAAAPLARAKEAETTKAERIAALEKTLTNSVLVGRYTTTGEDETPAQERYELGRVKHLGKDQWLIEARIKYGDRDLALPITIPIHWAGDTPVMSVTDLAFPGLGTYTARVMIYRDHYAGFWTGHDHGGHLFGVIERAKEDEAKSK